MSFRQKSPNPWAISMPSLILFKANALFVSRLRPSVFSTISLSKNGVNDLPKIFCVFAASHASSIIYSISLTGISFSMGTGFATNTADESPAEIFFL